MLRFFLDTLFTGCLTDAHPPRSGARARPSLVS